MVLILYSFVGAPQGTGPKDRTQNSSSLLRLIPFEVKKFYYKKINFFFFERKIKFTLIGEFYYCFSGGFSSSISFFGSF
jgi:hypothetical protein